MSPAAAKTPAPVEPIDLGQALSERYLAYALSTITARSLPDVRDGLKPVQRRILYAMLQLRLDPQGGFKKCARVVGDVIGKYHPHGDVAVYDALVRLAQGFAQRYPLVDGQGNFGNVDGDNAAAMRYTESRLTPVATALLDGLAEDAVDLRPTYDGSDAEPVVLPAAFPNLLANGSAGIAVGMATAIPPHNAGELLNALVWLAGRPLDAGPAPVERLLEHVQGPDLPTGGVIVDQALLPDAYRSGRGGVRLRARWHEEKLPHAQFQVVVTEIPYQVAKSRLVERVAELLTLKKLPLLADLRDESADTIRLVLVPRARSVSAALLMEQLFRATDLEVRLSFNMNVLDRAGVPRVMGLPELLDAFLLHRQDVLVRRSRHRLERVDDRIEVLDGYLKAFRDLDEVIRIIREEDEPKAALVARFALSERQAEAVLNLRLRQLRRLEETALREERARLGGERDELSRLIGEPARQRQRLKAEFKDALRRFGKGPLGDRRTGFAAPPVLAPELLEEPVERYPVTVVLSQQAWVRGVRGQVEKPAELRYKEGDGPRFVLPAQSTDKLLVLTSDGRCFTLPVDKLPGGRGQGEPLSLAVDLGPGAAVVACLIHDAAARLALASRGGFGFVVAAADLLAQTRGGRQVMNLAAGDRLAAAIPVSAERLALLASNRRLLVVDAGELPTLARGKGVILMKFKEDAAVIDALALGAGARLGVVAAGERERAVVDLGRYAGRRGSLGRDLPAAWGKVTRLLITNP